MKIVVAPDKFKGCLAAPGVAAAVAAGVRGAVREAAVECCPVADGGEGTVEALVAATGGRKIVRRVTGPLPEMKVDAAFGMLGDGQTAVVEMASASGLALLRPEERNPLATTTYGTGELLLAAVEAGAKRIILGIGGSATTDAGIGCAQAIGLPVLLRDGEMVSNTEPLCGRDLPQVIMVKHGRGSPIERVPITVACDVTNPLYGPTGAAHVFGPQKGASDADVRWLNQELQSLATRLGKDHIAHIPGAGAAGGLGFGMMAYLGATLRSGIDIMIDVTNLRQRLSGADLCITGEGKFDAQTKSGKAVAGVAKLCAELNVPCVAIVGDADPAAMHDLPRGLTAVLGITNAPMTLAQSIENAARLIEVTTTQVVRLWRSGRRS